MLHNMLSERYPRILSNGDRARNLAAAGQLRAFPIARRWSVWLLTLLTVFGILHSASSADAKAGLTTNRPAPDVTALTNAIASAIADLNSSVQEIKASRQALDLALASLQSPTNSLKAEVGRLQQIAAVLGQKTNGGSGIDKGLGTSISELSGKVAQYQLELKRWKEAMDGDLKTITKATIIEERFNELQNSLSSLKASVESLSAGARTNLLARKENTGSTFVGAVIGFAIATVVCLLAFAAYRLRVKRSGHKASVEEQMGSLDRKMNDMLSKLTARLSEVNRPQAPQNGNQAAVTKAYSSIFDSIQSLRASLSGIVKAEISAGLATLAGRAGSRAAGAQEPSEEAGTISAESKVTPDQESKQLGPPPPPPEPTVRQKVGLCFVKFCRGRKGEYPLGAFVQMVTEAFEGVSVKLVYRNAGAQEEYLTDKIESNPHRGWLVNAGNENMLLPCPVKADKFENSGLFEGGESVGPATIESCLPGLLQRIDQRWDIAERGKLATQRDLDLPPWDKPDREASMENGSRAEGGSGQPRPTASGSTAPLDAVKLGALFVRFCKEAVVPGKPITLSAFCQYISDESGLKEVTAKRLWLSQDVSESEAALYTDPATLEQSQSKTCVWLIVPGGPESKDGLLLPEVMADGRFAELQPAFRGERGQPPGTVADVDAARMERNEKNHWVLKTPGRVAGTAGKSVGQAEEVRVVVGAFLAACKEVAGNEDSKRALISREEAMDLLRKQFEKRGAKPELQELIWKGRSTGGAGQFEVRPKHRVDGGGGYVLIRFGGYANAVREYLVPLLGGSRLFAELIDNRGFKFANTNVLRLTPGNLTGFEPCLLTAVGNGVFDVSKSGRIEWK